MHLQCAEEEATILRFVVLYLLLAEVEVDLDPATRSVLAQQGVANTNSKNLFTSLTVTNFNINNFLSIFLILMKFRKFCYGDDSFKNYHTSF